ncbi:MAG: long-chain fatty acid--CoA ligase [Microbacteriaceae bacterium]
MSEYFVPAVVPADPDANATDLLIDRVAATPNAPLFSLPTGDGGWSDVTAAEFLGQVTALAKGFIAAGIEPGEKIGFICKTRYEWTLVDFAAWFAGALLVPIYETSSPTQIAYNLTDSGATALIVETAEHFARYDEIASEVPQISRVWQVDLGDLDKLANSGSATPDAEVERRRSLAKGADMATLIYTSGSTGRPKGCIITHSNLVELTRNAQVAMAQVVTPGSSTLLFITTAHIFARFISILAVQSGVRVGHQPDTKQLLPSLATFKPTFLLAVPRVFEKVYNGAEQKAEAGGKGKIFRRAAAVAIEHSKAEEAGDTIPLGLKLQFALFDKLVYSKLRAALGGECTNAVSGGAPLGTRLGHFFRGIGVTVLEGYGLTETTAPATVNLAKKSKIGSVGPVLPGVGVRLAEDGEVEVRGIGLTVLEGYGLTETTAPHSVNLPEKTKIGTVGPSLPGNAVRIGDDGEILLKGPHVFRAYWNNPKATDEAIVDGWFHTGDLGELDEDGYLRITGRKKEILVTAGGKNVAPAVLEDRLRAHPLVSQCIVVGDAKPFIAALVTLDEEMLPAWLSNNGLPSMTPAEAATDETVLAASQSAVDDANKAVSKAESIRKFEVLDIDFTVESGHLTPSLKLKRNLVMDDYADAVEKLYA